MQTITKHTLTKRQMLERVQFSKNLQIAIKANELLTGKLFEHQVKGMFLDAILRDDYSDTMMRADDHNKAALIAKDFTIGKFMFIRENRNGYQTGEVTFLKIKTISGVVEITPPVASDGEEMVYPNLKTFLHDWSVAI